MMVLNARSTPSLVGFRSDFVGISQSLEDVIVLEFPQICSQLIVTYIGCHRIIVEYKEQVVDTKYLMCIKLSGIVYSLDMRINIFMIK